MATLKKISNNIPDTFKAAVLHELGKPLKIVQLITPNVQTDFILVRLLITGVCRSQIMEISGNRGNDFWLPHMLGHEGVGEIVNIGKNVEGFEVGEKVILSWLSSTNNYVSGVSYKTIHGETINAGPITTFSEFSLIHKSRIRKLHGNFNDEIFALFGCAILTGVGMFISHFNPDIHKKILIQGFGGIGSAAAIGAAIAPGIDITIAERSQERIHLAKKMGFKNFLQNLYKQSELAKEEFHNFDLCLESTGTTEGIEQGLNLLSDTGTLVFASHPKFGDVLKIDPYDLIKGKKIFGTWGGNLDPVNFVKEISEYLKESQIPLSLLVGQKFLLSEINNAIEYVNSGKLGRAMIVFEA